MACKLIKYIINSLNRELCPANENTLQEWKEYNNLIKSGLSKPSMQMAICRLCKELRSGEVINDFKEGGKNPAPAHRKARAHQ